MNDGDLRMPVDWAFAKTTYQEVITACLKSGDWAGIVEWLSKAQKAKLKPDTGPLNANVDASAKSDYMDMADSYNAVIEASAKHGDMDMAFEWFFKAKEAGLNPDIGPYNAIIEAIASLRDFGDLEMAVIDADFWLSKAVDVVSNSF